MKDIEMCKTQREWDRKREGEKPQFIASNIDTFKGCSVTPPLRSLRMRLPIAAHCSARVRLRPRSVLTGEEGTVTGDSQEPPGRATKSLFANHRLRLKKFEPLKFPRFIRDNFLQRIFSTLILLAVTEVK